MFEPSESGLALDDAPWWLDGLPPDEPWTDADALREAVDRPVGVGLLADLLQVDPAALTPDEAVTFAQEVERFAAFVAGFQARARAGAMTRLVAHGEAVGGERPARGGSAFVTPQMLASAELAAALHLSSRTVDAQMQHAMDLTGPMAPLGEALLAGRLSASHAGAIARELTGIPFAADESRAEEYAALCARILAIVVPFATTHTPGQSARRTRGLVLATDPRGADERRRHAAEHEHGVWLAPTESGSCQVTAVLPIAHGRAMVDAITSLAQHPLFETSAGCITAGQRRVAALVTLVLGDPGQITVVDGPVAEAKATATVDVVVPLATILGASRQGGTIAGELVTADTILELLAEVGEKSTMRRLVVDAGGCVIDAGRTRYAISDMQRHLIALRDGTCRFPGCSRPAQRCEFDHATSWRQGGCTDADNLGPLCKHHHQLKTHGGWCIIASSRSGACTWRSPLGRLYEHQPPDLLPPDPDVPLPEPPPPF